MLIIKDYNSYVNILKDDAFEVLVSLHTYMRSKLHETDHVFYYNYKGNNQNYWGESYDFLEKLVKLPVDKRKNIEYIVYKESSGENRILFYYNKKAFAIELNRKHKRLHSIMNRLQDIFNIEDEDKPLVKKWKYLTYIMS